MENSVSLTYFTPMKLSNGLAAVMRNTAWSRPRMPPMINAEGADAICFFPCSTPPISKLFAESKQWTFSSKPSTN